MGEQEQKIATIKDWLGAGAINIFGLPMSGKDTQGMKLAEAVGGKFLSSGAIIREAEAEMGDLTSSGKLTPTNVFYDLVLPYFGRAELVGLPLVLSSIGRWSGEEERVMEAAEKAGHPIKAVVMLTILEQEALARWEVANLLQDRGARADDSSVEVFKTRIDEFKTKTLPVIERYRELGLLVEVRAGQAREMVFNEMITELAKFSRAATKI